MEWANQENDAAARTYEGSSTAKRASRRTLGSRAEAALSRRDLRRRNAWDRLKIATCGAPIC